MTKTIAETYSLVHENRKRIVWALLLGCLGMAFIYVMNVYSVISRTVALQDVESRMEQVGSEVDSLDAKFIDLSSQLTPESLSKYGMSQGSVSEYIYRSSALGMNK